jgi:hypothetical protein
MMARLPGVNFRQHPITVTGTTTLTQSASRMAGIGALDVLSFRSATPDSVPADQGTDTPTR